MSPEQEASHPDVIPMLLATWLLLPWRPRPSSKGGVLRAAYFDYDKSHFRSHAQDTRYMQPS
jgi:hypothetical protein